ncbi:uncharacterized protein LOC143536697 [Bidens hawaiensis]|uniref:uncharacterized protein LOC143536697 n=1 Tax=Bidens hawaiensis TaxID=980011 RepID=UPI00404B929E
MEVPCKVQNTAPVAPSVEKKPVEVRPSPLIDHARIPYPARAKHQKYTREYGHFLDMFRQLKINFPFIEALQHMPKYAKFLKDLLKRKERLGEVSSIPLMGDCSAVVLNCVPEKLSDPGMEKCFDYICGTDLVGSNGLVDCDDLIEGELCENDSVCDELVEISGLPEMIEVNEIGCESEADSVEKPAPLELKVLPSHLEYVNLDEVSNLPVIVSSKLTEEQKTKLIDVLKMHKGATAWRLFDVQGISPAYCTHRILMEDEYKPVVQPQRRLNPNMQEVVKKEVLKLMDAGMIYPISDSPWVGPTQVVPKKGGIVLGHKISRDGIEVDRAKIDNISRLPPPTNVKAITSFLGHAGFYRWFIKDFSKITHPMTRLLKKDVPFVFDDECVKAFTFLKEKLVSAPILCSPDWSLPFELMCDASDYAVGAILG